MAPVTLLLGPQVAGYTVYPVFLIYGLPFGTRE
jgi:hypothetical protein